jgi:hypothetical protein
MSPGANHAHDRVFDGRDGVGLRRGEGFEGGGYALGLRGGAERGAGVVVVGRGADLFRFSSRMFTAGPS